MEMDSYYILDYPVLRYYRDSENDCRNKLVMAQFLNIFTTFLHTK